MKKTRRAPSAAKASRPANPGGMAKAMPFPKSTKDPTSGNLRRKVVLPLIKAREPGWLKLTNKKNCPNYFSLIWLSRAIPYLL